MAQKKIMTQENINDVWNEVWRVQKNKQLQDILRHRLFLEGYTVFKKYIPQNVEKILDVGSGSGRYGVMFAKDFPGSKVVVTDVADEAIKVSSALVRYLDVNNVRIQKEDINELSFPNGTFDVVFCDVVIQHLPDTRRAMEEMHRVLKKGGIFIVSTMNTFNVHSVMRKTLGVFGVPYEYVYEKSYTPRNLRRLCESYNFQIIAVDGFYPAYGIYRLKKYAPLFGFLGRTLNRVTKFFDSFTKRFFSRIFGFEIFVVARK